MELSSLQEELKQLRSRIIKIEQLLGVQAPKLNNPLSSEQTVNSNVTMPAGDGIKEVTPPKPSAPSSSSSIGSRVLGAVAIFCFIIAGVYFVKLAIDSGWLTPFRQFAGLVLSGVALIYFSFQLRSKHGQYAGHLAGAGLAILYLAVVAGQMHWALFSVKVGICYSTAISALGIYLFRTFSSGYFAAATCLGTYAIPILIAPRGGGWEERWIYYLVWDIAFALFAVAWKERGLIALASYTGLLGGMLLNLDASVFVTFQIIQFLIFLIATGFYSIRTNEPLNSSEVWALIPGLFIFYGAEYSALHELNSRTVDFFALGFAAALLSTCQFIKLSMGKAELPSDGPIAVFVSFIIFHAGYLELTPESLKPWLGLAALATFFATYKEYGFSRLYLFLSGAIVLVETGKLIFDFSPESATVLDLFFRAAYGLGLLSIAVKMNGETQLKDFRIVPLFIANVLILLSLSSLNDLGFSKMVLGYLTSALWAGYAVGLLVIAGRVGDSLMARCSLVVFGLVALKILFIDSSAQGLTFRMVIFLVIGVFFYMGGALYGKVIEKVR